MLASLSLLALASVAIARPIAPVNSMLATVQMAITLPNTTQSDNASWYLQNGNAGACGLHSSDADLVVGLPTSFYNATGTVSSFCGAYVVVTNPINNMTVTSRVADSSGSATVFSLSVASWRALDGDSSSLDIVNWRFANSTETAEAKKSVASASIVPTVEATSATAVAVAAVTPTTTYVAPTVSVLVSLRNSGFFLHPSRLQTTQAAYVAPTTYAPTTTYTPTTYAPETTTYAAATTQQKQSSSSSSSSYSGTATYFYQGGAAGACGNVNSDSAYIVAIDVAMWNGGAYCGKQVSITGNGNTITATVADQCPGCSSSGSLDLSVGAFNALGSESAGVYAITWSFL
ncbi:hypothetical protein P7C70_g5590, partial [Phenoliferia sp. Uapishka_3]